MARIDDWLADNYAKVKAERGWTWAQMAEQAVRDGAKDLAEHFGSLAEAEPSARAEKPATVERAVSPEPEKRG